MDGDSEHDSLMKGTWSKFIKLFSFQNPAVKNLLGWKVGDEDEKWAEKAVAKLFKQLEKNKAAQNELIKAVSNPGEPSGCVPIPASKDGRVQVSHRKNLPHVIYCRVWRWPELKSHNELKPIKECKYPFSKNKQSLICVNPYHYERTDGQASLPPVILHRQCDQFSQTQQVNGYASFTTSSNYQLDGFSLANQEMNFSSPSSYQQPINNFNNASSQQINNYSTSMENYNNFMNSESNMLSSIGDSPRPEIPNPEFSLDFLESSSQPCGMEHDSTSSPPSYSMENYHMYMNSPAISEISATNMSDIQEITYTEDSTWGQIFYYELSTRVGEPFFCRTPTVTIDGFTNTSGVNRFCLGKLNNINRNSVIENTRRNIGKGVRFSYYNYELYAECLSGASVFIHSRNFNVMNSLHPSTVCKIPCGGRFKIFDGKGFYEQLQISSANGFDEVDQMTKMCIINLSFVKGWGQDYHRQEVNSTPCWMELHLNGPLKWLDSVLKQLNGPSGVITSVS